MYQLKPRWCSMYTSAIAVALVGLALSLAPGCPVVPQPNCDDGDACTTDTVAADGTCVNTAVTCDTGQTCDPATGQCTGPDLCDGNTCDDGNGCNGVETCDAATGDCVDGTAVECADGEGCNPATGACAAFSDSGVTGKFVGATTCIPCHGETHTNWLMTAHAGALEALEAIGQGENAACIGCHTVGFGEEGGFVDRFTTNSLAGVQCENCHGPAGDHVANVGDVSLRPAVNMSASVCGECHTDAHHPTFDEWQLSKHATALEGLRANAFANDACLECHSQDYRYAIEEGDDPPVLDAAADNAAQLSIECATCHAPHGGVAQEHQLRKPIANLCGECHTQEEATLGSSPHHPQLEMATGTGAVLGDGSDLTVGFSPHASLFGNEGEACARCHVVAHEFEDPDDVTPNVTGHTFNPFDQELIDTAPQHQASQYEGCADCHDAAGAEQRRTDVQAEIDARLAALAPVFDSGSAEYIDPATLSAEDQTRLSAAKFNYDFVNADGSRGVHNSFYARAALDEADAIVTDLSGG